MRAQIASAVNLIVQATRLQDGSRRMVSITEITGMEGEVISMQEVFRYSASASRPTTRSSATSTPPASARPISERFRLWGYDLPVQHLRTLRPEDRP